MNSLLRDLAGICASHPLREKVLICTDYISGNGLLENLSRSGVAWANLRLRTLDDLAQETASEQLLAKNLTLLDGIAGGLLFEGVFREQHSRLRYFGKLKPQPGISGALWRVLQELRLAGVGRQQLQDCLTNKNKSGDLSLLLHHYEQTLQQKHLVDLPELYRLALEVARQPNKKAQANRRIYLVPSGMVIPPHQWQLLQALAGQDLAILDSGPVYGLPVPRFARSCNQAEGPLGEEQGLSALAALYDRSRQAAGDNICNEIKKRVQLLAAYGEHNEIEEVLRRIRNSRIPLDQVLIAYTSGDYIWQIHRQAARLQLPVTYGEGYPFLLTNPGRGLRGIIHWVQGGFQAADLKRLLLDGLLRTGLKPLECAMLFNRAGIGWGRGRYLPCLERLATAMSSEGRHHSSAISLVGWLQRLLQLIPEPDDNGAVELSELAHGLTVILQDFIKAEEPSATAGVQVACQHLSIMTEVCCFSLPYQEALERVLKELERLRVTPQGPKPGHLHVTGFHYAGWVAREQVFVVGLDSGRFPGASDECPVLSDDERRLLSRDLVLGSERPVEARHAMVQFLAGLPGRVTLSYSCWNTGELRPLSPSSLLLNCFRLSGNPDADFRSFLRAMVPPAGYLPSEKEALDCDQWWLSRWGGEGSLAPDAVCSCLKWLSRGLLEADAQRYRGLLSDATGQLDPRLNPKLVLSASQLECLARCPYAFFLRYLLGLERPDERRPDPWNWLDPATRGQLLHRILSVYLRRLTAAESGAVIQHNPQMLYEIAEELLGELDLPKANAVVVEKEKRMLHRSLSVFLSAEKENFGSSPVCLEMPFGMGEEAVRQAGLGLADPVSISLPGGGCIRLRGQIDRLDRTSDGYVVIDYKTGSYKKYEGKEIWGGRQMQHFLYALAAEEALRAKGDGTARVIRGEYYFPTESGQGRRITREVGDRRHSLRALECLCQLLGSGFFIPAGEAEDCSYCDYTSICGLDQPGIRALLESHDPALEPLLEVRNYD